MSLPGVNVTASNGAPGAEGEAGAAASAAAAADAVAGEAAVVRRRRLWLGGRGGNAGPPNDPTGRRAPPASACA